MTDCPNCIRLTRELREAREELAAYAEGPLDDVDQDLARVGLWLGARGNGNSARILMAIMQCDGRIVGWTQLGEMIGYEGINVRGYLGVYICWIRKGLERNGMKIHTAWGSGWWIDKPTIKAIRAAIGAAG